MKSIMTLGLLLVTLFVSGLAYAADSLPGPNSGIANPSEGREELSLVFAGPKLGWIKMPTTAARTYTGGPDQIR